MICIKTFLIIDGHSLAYRGFHALNTKLTAPDGTPTGMIVGFTNMLFRVQDTLNPDCTIIAFDAHAKTFRHEIYKDYKAYRKPIAEDLKIQLPILQELLRLLGNNVIVREGVEADDVVASAARAVQSGGYEAVVLSADKDLFQLIGTGIIMMRTVKHGVSGAEVYDTEAFRAEFGFMPSSMADYLAIIGDKSDNVKGIAGIGEIGAKKILAVYPTLEDIYANIKQFPNSTRKKLEASGLENAQWTRDKLIKLRENVFDDDKNFLEDCLKLKQDFHAAEDLAARLGLARVLKHMGSDKPVISRTIEAAQKFSPPECEIITADYKTEHRNNPGLFADTKGIWDLKTAYYLLHPDETGSRFPDVLDGIRQSENPAQALIDIAGSIEAQIHEYEGLSAVMNDIDMPLIPVLNQMEAHGVRISQQKFRALQDDLETRIMEIEAGVIKETGVRINLNSTQQVSWLLFERLGFQPIDMTKNKAYSTNNIVLERLSLLPNGTVPRLILEHRELSKMLTGFVIPLQKAADNDGIIHTTFEAAATGTGRLSSRDPNLQNIPAFGQWAEKIKAGLVPVNDGNIFVAADYSQIELRVLAHMSGEERLIDAFRNKRDIHTETASWVFGVMPEMVTPELRRAAKMINFGLLYGMTAFGLAERLSIPKKEAREIMSRYFEALPNIQAFLEGMVNDARARGYARTLAGRIRPVKEIPAKNQALDRALINTPIQGTAADIARRAMTEYAHNGKGELFLQVHDSLVCECPQNMADDAAESLREIMTASGGEVEHLEVGLKCGKTLADV